MNINIPFQKRIFIKIAKWIKSAQIRQIPSKIIISAYICFVHIKQQFMFRPLLSRQRNKRQKRKDSNCFFSTEQLAQKNLIQISNAEVPDQFHDQRFTLFSRQIKTPELFSQRKLSTRNSTRKRFYSPTKSTQLRKKALPFSHSQINSGEVCIIKRKMPIDFSNLNFENENEKSQGIIKPYKPKPCIKSKTYFNRSSIISQTLPKKEDSHLSHISFLKKKIFSLQEQPYLRFGKK